MKITIIIIAVILFIWLSAIIVQRIAPQFGAKASGERLTRIQNASNFSDGAFQNIEKTSMMDENFSFWGLMKDQLFGSDNRKPTVELPSVKWQTPPDFPAKDAYVTWLGHSTLLVEMEGVAVLTDPVLSGHASPFRFVGPFAFDGSNVVTAAQLPPIDVVLISHDHYDHLDYKTILALKNKTQQFIVPLGVGAHLERWGVNRAKIKELNWWDKTRFGKVDFVAAPARHFSGRSTSQRNATLWSSWLIKSEKATIYFGGDSGYSETFKKIGEKYSGIDFAMLECGQYSPYWPKIHMAPEETAQAAADLKTKSFMPIHWAKFKLSIHDWKDPVERVTRKAKQLNVPYATPIIGQRFAVSSPPANDWWSKLK